MYNSFNLCKPHMKLNKTKFLQYFLIYLMIQYIGGRVLLAMGSDIFYGFVLLICMYLFITMNKIFRPKKDKIIFIITITFLGLITSIYTFGNLSIGSILSIISRFLIIYFAIKISPKNFLSRFLKMVFFLSIVSLILYSLVIIIGVNDLQPIYSKLYEIPCGKEWLGSSYGLFLIVFNFMDPTRNAYMFGEPGEYQSLIIISIFFLLFVDNSLNKGRKIKYLIIYLITLITIQSTTGYINLIALIMTCIFLRRNKINSKFKIVLIGTLIIAIVYILFFANKDSFIYKNFINKIFSDSSKIDLTISTGEARVDPLEKFLLTLKNTPLAIVFGVGYEGLKNTDMIEYSTCGLINNIVMFGSFFCIYMYGFMFNIMKYTNNSILLRCLIIFIVLNMGISQPDLLSIMSLLLLCYGWIIKDENYKVIKSSKLKGRNYVKESDLGSI